MKDRKMVFIPQDVSQGAKDFLSEKGYDYKIGNQIDAAYLKKEVAGCDAILARTAEFSAEVINAGDCLRVIARHGVGVDNIDLTAAEKQGVWVTNAPFSNALSVAEHTISLINALAKCIYRHGTAFMAGDFEIRNRVRGMEYSGKTLGIVGLGRIGSIVAKKAALGLDMKVLCYDPYVDKTEGYYETTDDLSFLLESSDFVTVHVPANEETTRMFGSSEFSLMKNSAFFINCSRGVVVNEADLIDALEKEEIAGAALDVFEQEPPAKDNPLFGLNNVILTPHTAGLTNEAADRMALHAAMEIDRVLSGERPQWPVNNPS